jgi:hypothetical protein
MAFRSFGRRVWIQSSYARRIRRFINSEDKLPYLQRMSHATVYCEFAGGDFTSSAFETFSNRTTWDESETVTVARGNRVIGRYSLREVWQIESINVDIDEGTSKARCTVQLFRAQEPELDSWATSAEDSGT